jgi:hypothetical protein
MTEQDPRRAAHPQTSRRTVGHPSFAYFWCKGRRPHTSSRKFSRLAGGPGLDSQTWESSNLNLPDAPPGNCNNARVGWAFNPANPPSFRERGFTREVCVSSEQAMTSHPTSEPKAIACSPLQIRALCEYVNTFLLGGIYSLSEEE